MKSIRLIRVLIVIVLVFILSVTGYYIYTTNKSATHTNEAVSSSANKSLELAQGSRMYDDMLPNNMTYGYYFDYYDNENMKKTMVTVKIEEEPQIIDSMNAYILPVSIKDYTFNVVLGVAEWEILYKELANQNTTDTSIRTKTVNEIVKANNESVGKYARIAFPIDEVFDYSIFTEDERCTTICQQTMTLQKELSLNNITLHSYFVTIEPTLTDLNIGPIYQFILLN